MVGWILIGITTLVALKKMEYPKQNMARYMVRLRTSMYWILKFPLNIAQIIIMSGIWLVYSHIYHHI